MSDAAVRAVDLVKTYEGGAIQALQGVSVEIRRGEFFGIMGPSGSGKSTLLNMIGALDHPTSGEVHLNGRALSKERDLDAVRAREVGFVFQLHNLIPTLTSVENVEIPMMGLGVPREERRRRAEDLLEQVGLSHRRESVATRLSGGERQRVSIARALANRPSVLLADEPTGDVDLKTGEQILECLLAARRQSGATLIVVTHNPDVVRTADRVMTMKDGRLVDGR
ncbi:MAG TPA: ABC transporter ATP-binding protein [Planctomycetota bacterium]|nr:ABC transporter ATP-binding protein [Planctomycetota bacterium]